MASATVPRAQARPTRRTLSPRTARALRIGVPVVVLVAMGLGTKVVDGDSAVSAGPVKFSAATYGGATFPKVAAAIEKKAVPAATLAGALTADAAAATKKYGVPGGSGPEFAVKLTGVVGKGEAGVYPVTVAGVPKDLLIRVQTGPAINGTDLRDATGTITFGQFVNQIEYQNAAAALNTEMKKKVLAKVGTADLSGRTISVTGAFQLINPKGWLLTPSKLTVS